MAAIARSEKPFRRGAFSLAWMWKKCSASATMSSRRSRSGGTVTGSTARR
jgi:hypothetical protein